MLSTQQWFDSGKPAKDDGVGRRITVVQAGCLAVIALLALAAYLTLDQTIRVSRQSATAVGLTDRERMLSQRIASLTAQYALGDVAVRGDLRAAITGFESAHRYLSAGDASAGLRPAAADSRLQALYERGATPLDAAVADYIARARRIAATSPISPALAAHAAPILLAAQQPLLDAFNAELQIRAERADEQSATLRSLGIAICVLVLVPLGALAMGVFRPLAQRIVRLVRDARELAEQATVDPLTGMLNERSFQARGAIEINKARRYGRPLSLLMIDADQLNAIEDTHGRDGGDTVLRALTSSFFGATRVSDLVARVDAEQFAILLPETSCEGAQLLAERLRHKISDLAVEINHMPVTCTISVGVAAAEKDASFLWPTFKRADEALYEAKMRGRNRVVVAAAA